VVLMEDVHWFDRSSVDLLETLAQDLHGRRMLILSLMRPERDTPGWQLLERARAGAAPKSTTVIDLVPLDREAALSQLQGMLGIEDMPSATRELLLAKTEGNPFYLEEVVRSLIDSGHIVRDEGAWRIAAPIREVDVPGTLSGVLSARIDRLPESTRRVALTAAVIGREFASTLLSAVLRDAPTDVPPDIGVDLGTLEAEALIDQLPLADFDYRFKHELTKDAAYQRLLLRRRRELHVRVAQELELRHADRLDQLAGTLSHHYLLGESWLHGAGYGLVAATQAVRLHALTDALESFEAIIAALERSRAGSEAAPATALAADSRRRDELYVDALVGWLGTSATARQHEDPDQRSGIIARAEEAVARARLL